MQSCPQGLAPMVQMDCFRRARLKKGERGRLVGRQLGWRRCLLLLRLYLRLYLRLLMPMQE